MLLLLPHDPLRTRVVDEHFAPEREAARDLGVPVALVDHDAICRGEGGTAGVPESADAVYRGWMIPAGRYAAWEQRLAARHTVLRTSAPAYRRAHELPGWYAALAHLTPTAEWTAGDGREGFEAARRRLGPGPLVLRDYCKSAKHDWDAAAFVPPDATEEQAWAVATRLRQWRDEEFTGGFVLRRFEPFAAGELRSWWVWGRCVLLGPHPDSPSGPESPEAEAPAPDPGLGATLSAVADAVAGLDLPFVTVDIARRADGEWRVVELGDGQVSDLPRTPDLPAHVRELLGVLDACR